MKLGTDRVRGRGGGKPCGDARASSNNAVSTLRGEGGGRRLGRKNKTPIVHNVFAHDKCVRNLIVVVYAYRIVRRPCATRPERAGRDWATDASCSYYRDRQNGRGSRADVRRRSHRRRGTCRVSDHGHHVSRSTWK